MGLTSLKNLVLFEEYEQIYKSFNKKTDIYIYSRSITQDELQEYVMKTIPSINIKVITTKYNYEQNLLNYKGEAQIFRMEELDLEKFVQKHRDLLGRTVLEFGGEFTGWLFKKGREFADLYTFTITKGSLQKDLLTVKSIDSNDLDNFDLKINQNYQYKETD